MQNSHEIIHVGIAGLSGSGKTTLASKIQNHIILAHDGRHFRLIVNECDELNADLQQYQIILVLFDLSQFFYRVASQMALELQKRGATNLCIIRTKLDLLPNTYSNIDLEVHTYRAEFSFEYQLPYLAINPLNDNVTDELSYFIVSRLHPSAMPKRIKLKIVFKKLIEHIELWVLDSIAAAFSLPAPKNSRSKMQETLELTDDVVTGLIRSPYAMDWNKSVVERIKDVEVYRTGLTAYRITPTLIAKRNTPSEAENMEYVRKHTKIPVPQPHYTHLQKYLVMDFVEGRMLLECWEEQSSFMKFRIACTLRTYLSQLRRLTRAEPGAVSDRYVSGILFENERYGPCDTSERFRSWCERIALTGWVRYMQMLRGQPGFQAKPPPSADDSWEPLVFAHHDLNLANVLLTDDGSLWLIDWAYAGFFPRCMDSVAMGFYADAPKSWRRYRWFIAGIYPSYDYFWGLFASDIHRYQPLAGSVQY